MYVDKLGGWRNWRGGKSEGLRRKYELDAYARLREKCVGLGGGRSSTSTWKWYKVGKEWYRDGGVKLLL